MPLKDGKVKVLQMALVTGKREARKKEEVREARKKEEVREARKKEEVEEEVEEIEVKTK
jgi:hypothetical protein